MSHLLPKTKNPISRYFQKFKIVLEKPCRNLDELFGLRNLHVQVTTR